MAARPLATIDGSTASSLAIGGGPDDTQLEPVTPHPPSPDPSLDWELGTGDLHSVDPMEPALTRRPTRAC